MQYAHNHVLDRDAAGSQAAYATAKRQNAARTQWLSTHANMNEAHSGPGSPKKIDALDGMLNRDLGRMHSVFIKGKRHVAPIRARLTDNGQHRSKTPFQKGESVSG
jgi:hypothetical protein